MMKKKQKIISTNNFSIPEKFYFIEKIKTSTIVKEFTNIEKIFTEMQYLACLTIQFEGLYNVEYTYGSKIYNTLFSEISNVIKTLIKDKMRGDDIFVIDVFDIDTFIVFLSPPRKKETKLINHLEKISVKLKDKISKEAFKICYSFIKKNQRISVGYSLILNNPMIDNLRQITLMVKDSKKMGHLQLSLESYINRYTLQQIIIEQNITTVFQPIVDIDTLEIIGYEALSRGPANTQFFSPVFLFMLASECGLSFELDQLCRKKAFENVKGIDKNHKIFVNSLSMTIHDPEYQDLYLKELIKDLELKPENVVFEISEQLVVENYKVFKETLKNYSDIGITHAADDIGKGYADLEKIMEINPGYMKIDMSFIRDINKNFIKQQIVKSMVTLAKGIKSTLIAEGVETKDEYEMLKKLKVDYGQGYLFGKPSKIKAKYVEDFS